jgi:catechol 2,3-dioxygenase-like lactoylglutathione lyase family enzyme
MTRLHHVQVTCPPGGESAVRHFYGHLLGLVEVAKPPVLAARGGVWFRGDDYELHVGVEDPFAPASRAHPGFLVDDVDVLARRLAAAGISVTWDPNFPGYRRFHAFDPHGNRVEILGAEITDMTR